VKIDSLNGVLHKLLSGAGARSGTSSLPAGTACGARKRENRLWFSAKNLEFRLARTNKTPMFRFPAGGTGGAGIRAALVADSAKPNKLAAGAFELIPRRVMANSEVLARHLHISRQLYSERAMAGAVSRGFGKASFSRIMRIRPPGVR